MAFQLSQQESRVLAFVLAHAPNFEQAATTARFNFTESGGVSTVAVAAVRGERPGTHAVFTLGSRSSQILMAVTDAPDPQEIAAIIAQLEDHDVTTAKLRVEDTCAMPDSYLAAHKRVAAVFLWVNGLKATEDFPGHAQIGGVEYHFALVVFLSADEYDVAKRSGVDALLDRFDSGDRDPIAFAQQ